MVINWVLEAEFLLTALFAAVVALAMMAFLERRNKRQPVTIFAENTTATVYLFDGDVLIDSTPSARALLSTIHVQGSPWTKLLSYLVPHFTDLEARLLRLPVEGAVTLASTPQRGSPLLLQAELRGGLTRLVLADPSREDQSEGQDLMAQRAVQEELDLLRETVARAPILMWRERANGDIIWANAAYMLRAAEVLQNGQDLTWPLPRLFEKLATTQNLSGQRQKLSPRDAKPIWYELCGFEDKGERLIFATVADALVHAETTLRDFMLTLTKTFAHLHVGLAIFDKQRQLVLFNPALMDLTGLPAEFLSMRPSLLSVLDGMRDRNMIPEPKDYRDWRRQLMEMERAASSGLYEETWSLPGGQTYRVIGRPHPNGALALMIEDISGEMLRTRRFRADLELSQSVIDEVDEAIAVFTPAGQLVMSNSGYARLWGGNSAENLSEETLRSLSVRWRMQCSPSTVWTDLEDFASNPGDRTQWKAEVRLLDGRMIDCRFAPLAGGATMTAFRLRDAASGPKSVVTGDPRLKRA
ncbi:PAS domain-containing protein [bacterium]|nr:PAS domain-containing protein [bacterium]